LNRRQRKANVRTYPRTIDTSGGKKGHAPVNVDACFGEGKRKKQNTVQKRVESQGKDKVGEGEKEG